MRKQWVLVRCKRRRSRPSRFNQPCAGSVFTVVLQSAGVGVQSREVRVDDKKWREFEACPHYHQCYDLSAGTFMVRQVVWQK